MHVFKKVIANKIENRNLSKNQLAASVSLLFPKTMTRVYQNFVNMLRKFTNQGISKNDTTLRLD